MMKVVPVGVTAIGTCPVCRSCGRDAVAPPTAEGTGARQGEGRPCTASWLRVVLPWLRHPPPDDRSRGRCQCFVVECDDASIGPRRSVPRHHADRARREWNRRARVGRSGQTMDGLEGAVTADGRLRLGPSRSARCPAGSPFTTSSTPRATSKSPPAVDMATPTPHPTTSRIPPAARTVYPMIPHTAMTLGTSLAWYKTRQNMRLPSPRVIIAIS